MLRPLVQIGLTCLLLLSIGLMGCGDPSLPLAQTPSSDPVSLAPAPLEERCGTQIPTLPSVEGVEEQLNQPPRASREFRPITIPVAYHVITSDTGQGDISDTVLQTQLDVLNEAYVEGDFSFRLLSIDRTANTEWFETIGSDFGAELEAKETLAISPQSVLNVYLCTSSSFLGFAYLPWSSILAVYPFLDGVVVDYESVPGGARVDYNEGDTLVHEVGHWLGLYHPFDFGCRLSGDLIQDTPAQGVPPIGCPVGNDTCAKPGLDPVFNFMNYSDDPCLREFSPGQFRRMQNVTVQFRPELLAS